MSNTAHVTGVKPIAIWSQSILGVSAIGRLLRHPWQKGRGTIIFFLVECNMIKLNYSNNDELNNILRLWYVYHICKLDTRSR
jgi:hypothetical protein